MIHGTWRQGGSGKGLALGLKESPRWSSAGLCADSDSLAFAGSVFEGAKVFRGEFRTILN